MKQKGKLSPVTSLFLFPEDFRDAFCVAGGTSGRPYKPIERGVSVASFFSSIVTAAMLEVYCVPAV